MAIQMLLFLLVFFLILGLVRLWHLYWPHLQPSHSKVGAMRTTVQRLLKPRTPRDCPACRLSCTSSSGVRSAPAPVRPWREVKSRRGAPKRVNTEGFACRCQQCPYSGITDAHIHATFRGWHAWPCRARPDISRPCLPHNFHCPAPHPLVSSENPLSPNRYGAVCPCRKAGCFRRRTGRRATVKPPSLSGCLAPVSTLSPCTSAPSVTSRSPTSSWMNCAPGCAAPHRCCGSGWQLIPLRKFFPCFSLAPARKT